MANNVNKEDEEQLLNPASFMPGEYELHVQFYFTLMFFIYKMLSFSLKRQENC